MITTDSPCPSASARPSNATPCCCDDGTSSIAYASGSCAHSTANSRLCGTKAFAEPALLLRFWDLFLRWRRDRLLLSDCCRGLLGSHSRDWLLGGCRRGFLLHGRVDGFFGWLYSRGFDWHLLCWSLHRWLLRRGCDRRLLGADGLGDHGRI